jgi:NhaP-type Na+/H+ or K+/H+ antiporter
MTGWLRSLGQLAIALLFVVLVMKVSDRFGLGVPVPVVLVGGLVILVALQLRDDQ